MVVKKGDKVKVDYTGTFDDGTVFDASEKHGEPIEFEVGAGQMIKGFDDAVVGMKKGEEKDIKLKPSEAYGEHDPDKINKLPRDKFPDDIKADLMVKMGTSDGHEIIAKVVKVSADGVVLDLNHPMAGKTLNFKIKVVEISSE
ncbi:peptidylprolyl isomerase [archaeon]|nr:peptidylprolyl isomerase [archaeon]|tara:strand:+ start:1709 stop:2137 length:429 start_codon:yes stop_codon:yes gene_type:complete